MSVAPISTAAGHDPCFVCKKDQLAVHTATLRPLFAAGLPVATALPLALASVTLSIAIVEIVDNFIMLVIPGAMDAHLTDPLLWGSLALALALAGLAAYPVNRWLIGRGRGHALVHARHAGHEHRAEEDPRPDRAPEPAGEHGRGRHHAHP